MAGSISDEALDIAALQARYAAERDKRLVALRADDSEEPTLRGAFADFDHDPYADPAFSRAALDETLDVLVIGGGIGGLLTAARLRDADVAGLRIVEKAADFGGTWYWNRYPGAACDVESYIYLPMLEETGYMPAERYAKAGEIRTYLQDLARRHALYDRALFQTTVTALRWDDDARCWRVETDRGDRLAARFVVAATGVLSNPKLPRIPGIADFAGHSFHTSRWDHAYSGGCDDGRLTGLGDKRVGIIGTGATALQVVPQVAAWAGELFVFQRTPSSVDVRDNRVTDPDWFRTVAVGAGWQRARQENFAAILSGAAHLDDMVQDGWTDIVRAVAPPTGGDADPDHLASAGFRRMEQARERIDAIVQDSATAAALKPYFHYFCKRPGFHDEYLDAFNRPNVTLVDTAGRGVERIVPEGVVVDGRTYPLDCLIYATGFDFMMDYARESGLEIHGRGGIALRHHWREGPRTLYAVQTDRFPNFYFLRLAQAGNSPNYTLTVAEQSAYVVDLITRCLDDSIPAIEPDSAAVDAWVNEVIEKSAGRQQFLKTCTPGQYNFEGNAQGERYAVLNELYGGGAIAYFEILRRHRANDLFAGIAPLTAEQGETL